MHSAAGSMTVAVTAVGFTTLFFIIIVLAAALALGYGRTSDGSRKAGRSSRRGGAEPLRAEKQVRSGFQPGGKFGVSRQRDTLSIEVNPNKCARFGFCEHEAPDVFYLESDGRFGYETVVPVEKLDRVISAMDVCPRRAITVKVPRDLDALAPPVLPEIPEDGRRTIIPIFGDRFPEDDEPRPRPRRA